MDVREYVGIPFAPLGRDRAGCDCYGLVRLALAERKGVVLPRYDNGYTGTGAAHAAELAALLDRERPLLPVFPVEIPEAGDIALLRVNSAPCHLGLVVAPGWMLHTEEGCEAITERYDGARWKHRLSGFYRVVSP